MNSERKTKVTPVKKSPSPKVRDSKTSKGTSRVNRKSDGGTLNPGPGEKK
jgi:hypothetical protein